MTEPAPAPSWLIVGAKETNTLMARQNQIRFEIATALDAVAHDLAAAGVAPLETEALAARWLDAIASRQAALCETRTT